jgi:hypothetical protein
VTLDPKVHKVLQEEMELLVVEAEEISHLVIPKAVIAHQSPEKFIQWLMTVVR